MNDTPTTAGANTYNITDKQTVRPFATLTIADVDDDALQALTVRLALDHLDNQTLTNLGGFTQVTNGLFTLTSTATNLTAALRGMVFVPTPNHIPVPTSQTTRLTLTVDDAFAPVVTNALTTVTITATNDAPTFAGSGNYSITDKQTVQPFATMIVADVDNDGLQPLTVRLTLDNLDKGGLQNLGGFTQTSNGVFQLFGIPTNITTALRGMVYVPVPNHIPVPTTAVIHLNLSADDSFVSTPTTNLTTVSVTASNDVPVITGTVAGQIVYSRSFIRPFVGVKITEVDNDTTQALRVTVTLNNAANGNLSQLGGFADLGGGVYSIGVSNGSVTAATLTNETISITTATGTRTQVWSYPGRQECLTCHTIPSGGVLGVKTRQLNGNLSYATTGVTDNQLRAWNHIGLFNPAVNETAITNFPKLVAVTDTSAALDLRVRSYLDANCAQCHRPNGGVPANFDARFDTPLDSQGIVGGAVQNNLGIAGVYVVAPGDTNKSILFQRDSSVAGIKMPPLAKNIVDANAMSVIADWILSLPPLTNGLPNPWQHSDVGNVGFSGGTTYAGGQFTVVGSGDDIWNNADAFHYVYQPLTGDGSITARVLALQNTDGWAKAGVMFRETLGNTSAHAMMVISSANGAAFQYRNATGGASTHVGGTGAMPYWVRLVRAGNLFTGYASSDGVAWTQVGNTAFTMANQLNVGLVVTAHNNSLLNTSVLDNVTITVATNIPPVVTLTAPVSGNNFTYPTNIIFTATATAANGGITNVSFFREAAKLGEDIFAPYNLTWSNAALGTFAVRATAMDSFGATGTSAPVNVMVQTVLGTNVYSVKVNFQTNAATLFPGYLRDSGLAFANRGNGFSYGWDVDNSTNARARNLTNSFDARYATFNQLQKPGGGATWEIAIPNGTYQVRIVAGESDNFDSSLQLTAEGVTVVSSVPTAAARWAEGFGLVTVNDGRLTVTSGAGATNNKIDFIEITTAVTVVPPINLTAATQTNGAFQFALQGLNGVNYIIEASTNLTSWKPVLTNSPVSNLLQYVELGSSNFPARFYRGRLP